MDENEARTFRVRIPYQVAGLAVLWTTSVALAVTSTFEGSVDGMWEWALMLACMAAVWTTVLGVKAVVRRVARCAVEHVLDVLISRGEVMGPAWADEVVRRLEVRDLEKQVAHLISSQQRGGGRS